MDDESWRARLVRDKETLKERLGDAAVRTIGASLTVIDDLGRADFVVVYGKAARLGIDEANDIDFYFEAAWLPAEKAPVQIEREENGTPFHAYGWPRGALIQNLRKGDGFAFGLLRDALIFVDRGPFRDVLIVVDEECLALAEGESMDKPEQESA
jgi:hypothetical protein